MGPVIFLNRLSSVVFKIYKDEVAHPRAVKGTPAFSRRARADKER